jgi:hypothetical protein
MSRPAAEGWAVAGALAVLVGAQLPAIGVEYVGGVSFLELGGVAGTALLAAALGALVALAVRSPALLRLCAAGLWVALLWPALRLGYERAFPPERGLLDELGQALGDAFVPAIGTDGLLRITGLRAGAFVLPAGCVLVSAGAFRRRR